MCEATTIAAIGLAISAAGTAASVYGQHEQQRGQARFQRKSVEQADAIAKSDFQNRTSAAQAAMSQEEQAAAQKKEANNIAAAKAIAHAKVMSGEAGVVGTSVDNLYADYASQQEQYNASVNNNTGAARAQYHYDILGFQSQGQQYLNGFNYAPIPKVDYLGAAAELGGGAMGVYDRYQINKDPKGG